MLLHARLRFAIRYLGTDMLHVALGPLAALGQVVPDTDLFSISGSLHGFHEDSEIGLLVFGPVLILLGNLVALLADLVVLAVVLVLPLNEVLCPEVYLVEGQWWQLLSSSDCIVGQDRIYEILEQLLPGDHVLESGGEGPVLRDDAAQVGRPVLARPHGSPDPAEVVGRGSSRSSWRR